MKKIFGFVIIMFTLISCQYFNQLKNDKHLADEIEAELKAKNGEIDFSQFNDFKWDSLIILGPYSIVKHVEKELNLNLKNIRLNGIEYSDYYYLIVFLKKNKSVKIIELNKAISPTKTIINKNKSHFSIDNEQILRLNE